MKYFLAVLVIFFAVVAVQAQEDEELFESLKKALQTVSEIFKQAISRGSDMQKKFLDKIIGFAKDFMNNQVLKN
ncbi:hypothetical protein FQR65_LT10535 [Abscondita terminalis]|nr:hypothetical protein FQR65_LT10535 [Abscondita terminalis]